ncbi:unnamed protein product [Closterium sp. NIES-53]
MEVARTSMIHAAAPHFLWPFPVRYAAHQLNLWPRVSEPKTLPTLRWTGKVGDASVFRVWGALSLVRDAKASKLSSRTLRYVFLGFPIDTPLWQFYHPRSRLVFSSQDVTFDESVYFYRLHPHASHPGLAPSGVSQVDPPPLVEPLEISSDSSVPAKGGDPAADDRAATRHSPRLETPPGFLPRPSLPPLQPAAVDSRAEIAGAEPGGAETEGEGSGGATTRVAATGGTGSWGAATGGADSGGPSSPSGGGAVGDPARGPGAGQPPFGGGGYGPAGARGASPGGTTGAGGTGGTAGGVGGAAGGGGTRGAAGAGGAGATSPSGATGAGGAGPISSGGTAGAVGAGGAARAGGARARGTGGAGAAGPGGARTEGAGAAEAGGVVLAGGASGATGSGGTGGTAGAGGVGATGASGTSGTRGTGGAGAAGPGGARTRGAGATGAGGAAGAGGAGGATRATGIEGAGGNTSSRGPSAAGASGAAGARGAGGAAGAVGAGGVGALVLEEMELLRVVLPETPASSLPHVLDTESDLARAASPTVTRLLANVVTYPDLESTSAFALVTELVDFAARIPPSVGGDPDALDIPTPRSYAEAIADEFSSQWQTAMDAERASWKSTSTYVDEVPPRGANIVDGTWIFRVKRLPCSPPAFKARHIARGFCQ